MLTLSGISKAYGGRVLFADVTLQVNRQDRLGLVGPNGAGKTTLFSLMLGEESADDGKIMTERNVVIGYLPQESAPVTDETVIEIATAISPEFVKLRRVIKAWEHDHPIEATHPEDIHDDVHERRLPPGWQRDHHARRWRRGRAWARVERRQLAQRDAQ